MAAHTHGFHSLTALQPWTHGKHVRQGRQWDLSHVPDRDNAVQLDADAIPAFRRPDRPDTEPDAEQSSPAPTVSPNEAFALYGTRGCPFLSFEMRRNILAVNEPVIYPNVEIATGTVVDPGVVIGLPGGGSEPGALPTRIGGGGRTDRSADAF